MLHAYPRRSRRNPAPRVDRLRELADAVDAVAIAVEIAERHGESVSVHKALKPALTQALGSPLGPSADWINAAWSLDSVSPRLSFYLVQNDDEGYDVGTLSSGGEFLDYHRLPTIDRLSKYVHELLSVAGGHPEAPLTTSEWVRFEEIVSPRYTLNDLPDVSPQQARLVFLFQDALRQIDGAYAVKALKVVPGEHVSKTAAGRLMVIFEDVFQTADEVMFSETWQEAERARGADLESYNAWSATVR